ncbi:shikimate kinase I [Halorhodospira halochloris]|uniref:Shikimate kinase n=1 Tax=Halorhodospira halochloris TaxID=1052 RepID=A0A0X8X754_HALHR|nr:shikimate kinase AroK [Halorhodospira halochloris]MBK1650642.1 shikimate kinase I [Halorhodospira halochloris]BAU56872.1 shikimate kinase I [Halorhodospira halochloris]
MAQRRIPSRIFLVGPMGAGKTTIGRELASRLGFRFVDSDSEIERKTGVSIPWIFDIEGEQGFRQREAAVIDQLTQQEHLVLATGGGAVTTPSNRDALSARGIVIYLFTPVQVQLQRTRHDTNRPLLQSSNPRQRLEELMQQRDPLYRQIADLVIESSSGRARGVAKRIEATLEKE